MPALLGTIEQVSLGSNRAVPLGNDRDSVLWEQLCQRHLGTIVLASLSTIKQGPPGSNRASVTWK